MILRINELTKEYGKNDSYQKILDNISIEFKSGEFVCILGESGSGKSTLLNIIGGLDNDYVGSVNYNNINLKYINLDNYRSNNIGFIFQNFNLIPSLSVIDNIILPIEKINIKYVDKKRKAINLLKRLNIYNIRNKKINELSGGQKQRIAIARALISDPLIILADEPTGALDEENSNNILEILKEINKEGKLVIVVTHSSKVIDFSTRVINIKDGKIIKDKKLKRIKEKDIDKYEEKNNNIFFLLKYGIRNICNNMKKNLFIMFASSIGIVGIILSMFIGNGIKEYVRDLIIDKVNPLVYTVSDKNNDNTKYFTNDEIKKINKIDHIDNVNEGISYPVSTIKIDNEDYNLTYLESFNEVKLDKGNRKDLVVSKSLCKKIGDCIGKKGIINFVDNYNVFEYDFEITGIISNTGISLIDNSYTAYLSYDIIKSIYDEEDIVFNPTILDITIDNEDNINSVKNDLNKMNLKCINNEELYKELNTYLSIATFVLSFFSSLSLFVSVIMISIITNLSVLERIKEIGLLRSIGYTKKDIKNIFNIESIILGFTIGIFSSCISKIFINIIIKILKNNFNILFNIKPTKYYFFGILLSILLLLISSYFPSKKASKQDPINSLRYE